METQTLGKVTIAAGRFRAREWLGGSPERGRARVEEVATGRTGLATFALPKESTVADAVSRLRFAVPGVATLEHAGPLDPSPETRSLVAIVELEPSGVPVSTLAPLDPRVAVSIVLELGVVALSVHGTGAFVGTLRPELTYVSQGHLTGTAPRCERFLSLAASPCAGGPPPFPRLYLAPELLQSNDGSPGSDVFSLAAILSFLVTGAHPFEEGELLRHIARIVASQRQPFAGPAWLEPVIASGLDPAPGSRPPLAAWLGELNTTLTKLDPGRVGAA